MKLTSLRNIGKEMERKLNSIGITSSDDLIELGSKETYFRLKLEYPEICLVHLYTIHGAIIDVDYNMLANSIKSDLKIFSDKLK